MTVAHEYCDSDTEAVTLVWTRALGALKTGDGDALGSDWEAVTAYDEYEDDIAAIYAHNQVTGQLVAVEPVQTRSYTDEYGYEHDTFELRTADGQVVTEFTAVMPPLDEGDEDTAARPTSATDTNTRVPEALRPWSVPWPDYRPVDVTPPELQTPDRAVTQHWVTDTETDPAAVSGLLDRQATALVEWRTDDRGRPLNPAGRTGRTGRNLGAWGENACVDPIVFAGNGADRHVLLILRDDCHQWAIPGGHVDPDETPIDALARELLEETGVDVSDLTPRIVARTLVDDPRSTDHAWIATVAATYHLAASVTPKAGSDAADARWWPARDFPSLEASLSAAGQRLYDAHRELLTATLDG